MSWLTRLRFALGLGTDFETHQQFDADWIS